MIVDSFCSALKYVHITSCHLSVWVHGHRTCGRCGHRAQAVARLLSLASLRARVMPRSAYGLALAGPRWLRWSCCCTCAALAQLATGPRHGYGCIAWSKWCSPHPSSYLPRLVLKLEPCHHDESRVERSGDGMLPCPVLPASQHRRSRLGPAACCYERHTKPPGLVTYVHELALPPLTGASL